MSKALNSRWAVISKAARRELYKYFLRELLFYKVDEIVRRCKIKTVLDLGCGTGLYFPLYHTLGCNVLAIDSSTKRLSLAKEMVESFQLKNMVLKEGNFLSEDFPDNFVKKDLKFDCIMLSYVLEHQTKEQVKLLVSKIRGLAKYYIVVGYYSEPTEDLIKRYTAKCIEHEVKPYTFNVEKTFTCIAHDYPKVFNMKYELYQFPRDVSLIFFKKGNE